MEKENDKIHIIKVTIEADLIIDFTNKIPDLKFKLDDDLVPEKHPDKYALAYMLAFKDMSEFAASTRSSLMANPQQIVNSNIAMKLLRNFMSLNLRGALVKFQEKDKKDNKIVKLNSKKDG